MEKKGGIEKTKAIKKAIALIIFLALLILAFFIIKPFIISILTAIFLAYLFFPLHKNLSKFLKSEKASAAIITAVVIIGLAIIFWITAQIAIKEAFDFYSSIQKIDFSSVVEKIVSLFTSNQDIVRQITLTIQQSIGEITNSFMTKLAKVLTNSPSLFLQLFVTFFVMFFFIKDSKKIEKYIRELMPFKKETSEKFFFRSRQVTKGFIYGSFLVGLIQGATAAIGFYIFKAPNPLLLSIAAIFISILPFIGPWLIWIPVSILMIAQGNILGGFLLLIYGVFVISTIDNLVRPFIVGKKARVSEVIILVGMLGGISLLGIIGIIIGPLVLEYLLLFADLYKKEGIKGIV